MAKKAHVLTKYLPKVLLVGVKAPYNRTKDIDSYFHEFLNLVKTNLVKTNGVKYNEAVFIKLRSIDSAYFLTKGKLQELKEICEKNNIEEVIFSEPLTAQQERNLSDYLNCEVYDRTFLILEIFEKAAHTAEGKAQVAIAMLKHQKTRLAGKGIHLAQQAGIIGVRGGPGETLKEKEARIIDETVRKLKKQLARMQKAREVQRKRRIETRVPHICLIGYTNAGKSTILNAITKSDVLAEDKLFATLDTTTRELYIGGKKKGVISDTVGFIQQLPHHLIEAFKSTLSELNYADLLIQVVDLSDANWESHIKVVNEILKSLDLNKNMLYVFNKKDQVANLPILLPEIEKYQPHVIVSARSKKELQPLLDFVQSWERS